MRNKITLHHLLLVGALAIGSCQKEYVIPKPPTPQPQPGSIKFAADIVPIFTANCALSGCHDGANVDPNLTPSNAYAALFTLNEIDTTNLPSSAVNSNLYKRMTETASPMPPSGKLSSTETDKVLAWIQAGAKNN